MENAFGLDVDYFNRLFKRELAPSVVANQTPEDLARVLMRAARTACPGVIREEEFEYEHLRGPGQLRVGDRIKFKLGGKELKRKVKDVLNHGTHAEEIIYSTKRNYYFITSNVLAGKSGHSAVMVRIRPLEKEARP